MSESTRREAAFKVKEAVNVLNSVMSTAERMGLKIEMDMKPIYEGRVRPHVVVRVWEEL